MGELGLIQSNFRQFLIYCFFNFYYHRHILNKIRLACIVQFHLVLFETANTILLVPSTPYLQE